MTSGPEHRAYSPKATVRRRSPSRAHGFGKFAKATKTSRFFCIVPLKVLFPIGLSRRDVRQVQD